MPKKVGRFLVAVGAIVEDPKTSKILLLKRSENKDFSGGIWEYTTGRMNQFEDPKDALLREIMEESGIKAEIVKPISYYHIFRGEKTPENELVGIMFWCRAKSTKIKISKEHTDFQWIAPEKALRLIKKQSMKEDIKAYLREKKEAVLLKHRPRQK